MQTFTDNYKFAFSPDVVMEMMLRDNYLEEKHRIDNANIESREILLHDDKQQKTRVLRRLQVRDQVPFALRRVVPEKMILIEEYSWNIVPVNGVYSGSFRASIQGLPGQLSAELTLSEHEVGSQVGGRGEVRVNMPIVGGKVEKLIADIASGLFRADLRATRTFIEEQTA